MPADRMPAPAPVSGLAGLTVREVERRLILETLASTRNNRTHAARLLGISIRTLRNKLAAYRLQGELLLKLRQAGAGPARRTDAESCFRQAITVARRMGGKSLELRAALSLSRLLQEQGKKEEARSTLAEVYDWFTEGLDTPDLQEAKALLEEVS